MATSTMPTTLSGGDFYKPGTVGANDSTNPGYEWDPAKPEQMFVCKKATTPFRRRELFYIEEPFPFSTVSLTTPVFYQRLGEFKDCSELGKLYNKLLNESSFTDQYSRTVHLRYEQHCCRRRHRRFLPCWRH